MQAQRTYTFNNSTVRIFFGDLLTSKDEVIVISGSVGIPMIGGLPEKVRKLAGGGIDEDIAKHGDAKLGDVVVTTAGELDARYLFHAVTVSHYVEVNRHLDSSEETELHRYIIRKAVEKSLSLLSALDLTSIAFPCLGLGMGNIPVETVSRLMAETISKFLTKTNKSFQIDIYIYDSYNQYTAADYAPMVEWFGAFQRMWEYEHESRNSSFVIEDTDVLSDGDLAESLTCENTDIFISYSRADKELVDKICGMLQAWGIKFWIDRNGIFSGERFKMKIVETIKKSKAVLFVSSQNSNRSENVCKEISIADKFGKAVIPIRLDDSPYHPNIEYDLSNIDYIDLPTFNKDSLNKLRVALQANISISNSTPDKQTSHQKP